MNDEAPDRFDVVIVPFPFTDLPVRKRRPALVLSQAAFNGINLTAICAMITSARDSEWHEDQPIEDLDAAGLRSACKVRMKLFSMGLQHISSPVGRLASPDQAKVKGAFGRTFGS